MNSRDFVQTETELRTVYSFTLHTAISRAFTECRAWKTPTRTIPF